MTLIPLYFILKDIKNFLILASYALIGIEILLMIALWKDTTSFWKRYLNLPGQPQFLILDYLIIALTPQLVIGGFWWFDDLLWVHFAIVIILYLFIATTYIAAKINNKNGFPEKASQANNNLEIILKDDPINDDSEDLINRKKFVSALKEHIYKLSSKEAFVLALYGEWGEGKTSVLNLLKNKFAAEDQLLMYEFNPWYFDKGNDLTTNFYRGLEDLLRKHYILPKKIKRLFEIYSNLLAKRFIGFGLPFKRTETGNQPIEVKKELEQFVASLNKKTLVIIDDIDRLQADQILAVFRLVKLTSHIKDMVFLLSFDWNQVISILKKSRQIGDPRSYLEKIVQLPLHLPTTNQNVIDDYLLFPTAEGYQTEIGKLFDRLEIDENSQSEFYKDFRDLYQSELRPLFSTFRTVKRFINSISFRLPFVKREVYLYDFFIIEILRVFYPDIYSDIKKSPWVYAVRFGILSFGESFSTDPEEKIIAIKQHIENLIQNHNSVKKNVIISLLKNIFPEINSAFEKSHIGHEYLSDYRLKKRVAHPECFPKYFRLQVSKGETPDAEIDDLIKKWEESTTPEAEIVLSFFEKYQKENTLADLLEQLKLRSNIIDEKLVQPLINVIYKNCAKYRRDGEIWFTEYDKALEFIFLLLRDNKNIKDQDISKLLEEIIEKTKCFDFISNIVLDCQRGQRERIRPYNHINADELRNILDNRLHGHFITNNNNIFEEYPLDRQFGFILYQWATLWEKPNGQRQDKVTSYLVSLFDNNPPKAGFFLSKFLSSTLVIGDRFDHGKFVAAYDPKIFHECLKKLGANAYSTESERKAVELFMEAYSEFNSP